MKVLITNPPWLFNKYILFGRRCGIRAGSRWPFSFRGRNPEYIPYPGFMGYAMSYLQSKGIEVRFYDAIAWRDDYKTFFKKIDDFKPDIIIQETSAASFDIDLKICRKLHKKGYETCLVGPQATAFSERLIELPFVNYILKGAYEYSALEICQTQRKGIYDYNLADLDDLPYPYRNETIIHQYRDFNCLKKLAFPQLWIYASRGCVFHCNFCLWAHTMFNNKFSLRKAENVLSEIDDMVKKYDLKHIYFDDDCWNIGPQDRLKQIADGLYRIGLPWTINARIDTSTKEMFSYFVDRGCVGLRLGVESLSQPLLDITHKDLKVEDIIDKIKFLEKLDVELYLLFMHYMPSETQEDRNAQNKKIAELGHRYQNPPCIPYPGTPYYHQLITQGFDPEEKVKWCEYDGSNIGYNLMKIIKEYSRRV